MTDAGVLIQRRKYFLEQIKLMRSELADIEKAIRNHPDITASRIYPHEYNGICRFDGNCVDCPEHSVGCKPTESP